MAAAARNKRLELEDDDEDDDLLFVEEVVGQGSSKKAPPQPETEFGLQPRFFKESLKTLEELAKFLACVKCGKLSQQRIYTLGNCTHKYCEKCVTFSAGKPCVTCKAIAYPKDAKPDLFSTSILNEIPAVYYAIARMEKMGIKNSDEEEKKSPSPDPAEVEEKQVIDLEETTGIYSNDLKSIPHPFSQPTENSLRLLPGNSDEEEGEPEMEMDFFDKEEEDDNGDGRQEVFAAELDEEVFENTPVSHIIPTSPDPDIMEETPQHKLNTSMIAFNKKGRPSAKKLQPKVLQMDSPKKKGPSSKFSAETVAVETPKSSEQKKIIDNDETLFSEEELFKSQSDGSAGKGNLPVLTPHPPDQVEGTNQKKKLEDKQNPSKDDNRNGGDGEAKAAKDDKKPKGKLSSKGFFSSSSSEESFPPALTPHHSSKATKMGKTDDKPLTKSEAPKKKTSSKPEAVNKANIKQSEAMGNGKEACAEVEDTTTILEELFRSPISKGGDNKTGRDLPILSPHIPKQQVIVSKVVEKSGRKRKSSEDNTGNSDTIGSGKSNDNSDPPPSEKPKKFFKSRNSIRSSEEEEPPALTPHPKAVTQDEDFKTKKPKRASAAKQSPAVTTSNPKASIEDDEDDFKPKSKRASRKSSAVTPTPQSKEVMEDEEDDYKPKPKRAARKSSTVTPIPQSKGVTEDEEEDDYKPKSRRASTKSKTSLTTPMSSKQPESKVSKLKPQPDEKHSPVVAEKRKSQPRAGKSKLNISASGSTPEGEDDDLQMNYEFEQKAAESSRKRRKISIAGNRNTSSISLMESPGGALKDKEKRNAKGETGLHVACRAGQFDKVKSLVEGGADVNATDNAGWTPLHETIGGKSETNAKAMIVRFLCENNCNINVVGGPDDDTPLHSASVCGLENIVEVLLEFGASPNIRNSEGRLPVDVAFNDIIIKMLAEKTSASTSAESSSATATSPNYNSALTTSTEEDPAVIQVMLKKALVYFNYELEPALLDRVKRKLKLKLSEKLTSNVTHIVHYVKDEDRTPIRVPFSMEYVFGLAHGMWQVSHDWIEKSIKESKCLSPTAFEVAGNTEDANGATHRYPVRTRINKEKGNPGLLDGFTFYLYKTCGYESSGSQEDLGLKLGKRELSTLIQGAGGKVTNREPNPDSVDPLEHPTRFHANQGSPSQSPFVLTSHVILYDEKTIPPKGKMYTMEHVKTLKSNWVIESIAKFCLEDPENFY